MITDEYLHSLQQLKTKCLKSNFNLSLVNKILKIATTWQNCFSPDSTTSSQQVESKKLVWAIPFTKFISFDKTGKKLISSALVIYKNPPTFREILNIVNILHTTPPKTMIIMAFPNRAINAPYAANTVITLIW